MDLARLVPYLLHEFKSEHDLLKAIEEISLKFTRERGKINDYLEEPRLVSAYVAFFLTTNIPKFEAVLKWLPQDFINGIRSSDLIDLGAGPGTMSIAFREWAGSEYKGTIHQVETSRLMREQGLKIWNGLFSGTQMKQSTPSPGSNSKFLLFGHSANEMGAEDTYRYIQKINPDYILFIEPGTKGFFPEMLKIRDALIEDGFHVRYPCPNNSACPMKGSEADWCHQFVYVKLPADVERLTQMAKKDRRLLPVTVHAYAKKKENENPKERLVRVLPESKFSYDWEVCHENKLEHYQIMKRPYSKSEQKVLGQILAGEPVLTELEKDLDKMKRVKLLK